jgi:arylsulfatase A-like enzyme
MRHPPAVATKPASRPNVVLILTDEQHVDALGHRGRLPVETPHVDRLAAEGMVFEQAFCCTSVCSPSRAGLFTGTWPHRFDVVGNNLSIPAGTPNLASLFKGAGYRLGYAGKWHVDKRSVPTDHGFEGKNFPGYGYPSWMYRNPTPEQVKARPNAYHDYLLEKGFGIPKVSDPFPTFLPERKGLVLHGRLECPVEATIQHFVAEEAIGFVRKASPRRGGDGRPFFLWTNFWEPHNPCYLPEPWYSRVNPRDIPEPPSFRETFAGKPHVQVRSSRYWGVLGAPWSFWQEHLARYLGSCALVDAQVGRIRAALEEEGLWENTVLVFASDHGDMMGRHQLMDKGPFMYDDTYRVPMIVTGPGVRRGRCDELVYLQDLFRTLPELAGATETPNADFDRSLVPLLRGDAPGWAPRAEVFGEFDTQISVFPQRMIRTRTHKFIYNDGDFCEHYDLAEDPHEMRNLVDDPARAAAKRDLRERLFAHAKSTRDPRANAMGACLESL